MTVTTCQNAYRTNDHIYSNMGLIRLITSRTDWQIMSQQRSNSLPSPILSRKNFSEWLEIRYHPSDITYGIWPNRASQRRIGKERKFGQPESLLVCFAKPVGEADGHELWKARNWRPQWPWWRMTARIIGRHHSNCPAKQLRRGETEEGDIWLVFFLPTIKGWQRSLEVQGIPRLKVTVILT